MNEVLRKYIDNVVKKYIINEVRYIDSRYTKYHGKVQKKNWYDIYNQEPIKNNEKIRVYHGCDLKTALSFATSGISGKIRPSRTYSYESGMNPLGLFVTVDFEKAKDFGYDSKCTCIIEFTANASDLESPVWNGQGSFFGVGSNPQPFRNKEERNAQKQRYRDVAANLPDETPYFDIMTGKEYPLSKEHIRKSDKPEMAERIFDDTEHQALFMGDINPNQIKRIWVNDDSKEGYVSTTNAYIPLTVKQFVKKYGKQWEDKKNRDKVFLPNEDVRDFDDFADHVVKYMSDFFSTREEAKNGLKSTGLLSKEPPQNAISTLQNLLWPKQIIQLYGKDFFDKYFNPLGQ